MMKKKPGDLFLNEEENERYDYILVDFNNMFFRCRYSIGKGDLDNRIGLTAHFVFNSIFKLWKMFGPATFVVCADSNSWREEIYQNYKLARKLKIAKKSQKERKEDEKFYELHADILKFFRERSNFIVLKQQLLEADDFIASWIKLFSDRKHVIASTDSDFVQLVSDNVSLFNYDRERIIKPRGIFDMNGHIYKFSITRHGKIKIGEKGTMKDIPENGWTEWALFCKAICGDVGDGIFPVVPRISLKKIKDAFDDRFNKGFHWNNLMMETIETEDGKARFIDKYRENLLLIDLKNLPEEIYQKACKEINHELSKRLKTPKEISFPFLKFCGKYYLNEISNNEVQWIKILSYRNEYKVAA